MAFTFLSAHHVCCAPISHTSTPTQAFLLRFRPVNAFLDNLNDLNTNDPSSSSPTSTTRGVSENVEAIIEMLQKNRYELESLFRHFGQDNDTTRVQHTHTHTATQPQP